MKHEKRCTKRWSHQDLKGQVIVAETREAAADLVKSLTGRTVSLAGFTQVTDRRFKDE